MKEKLAKLIDVKTIITFALVFSAVALAFMGRVEAKEILTLTSIVVAYFFGTKQAERKV